MTRRTICIDCRYIRERPSGISPLVQALVDYAPGLYPEADFLFLKHPKGPPRLSLADNAREIVLTQEANGPATLFWLPRVVDLRGIDLFHATFNILPHGLRMRSLVTLCDVMWLNHPEWCRVPGPWGHVETVFYQHGIQHALREATRIAAISQATKDEIAKLDPEAAERTRVTLLGVSEDFKLLTGPEGERAIADVKTKWLRGADRYVLTVGQFAGYKNHERVVRAFAAAFEDDPGIHLGLVQRLGAGQEALAPIARSLGVHDRVHFLSGVPFPELVALYNGALCLCHPSLEEGFGNPPSEALGCGCPIVTSNRSSMPQVSGDAALFVDPENVDAITAALRKVAYEPGVAAGMRARGLERVKALRWKAFAEANVDVYREMLE